MNSSVLFKINLRHAKNILVFCYCVINDCIFTFFLFLVFFLYNYAHADTIVFVSCKKSQTKRMMPFLRRLKGSKGANFLHCCLYYSVCYAVFAVVVDVVTELAGEGALCE